jgi:hypothetical protein
MATVKTKKPQKPQKVKKSNFALPGKNPAKPVILTVIGLAGLTVILATFSAFYFTPERVVKDEIDSLAKSYYENKIYENIINANATDISSGKKSLETIMEKYTRVGFSPISLRQLFLVGSGSRPNTTAIITKYCNENTTSLTFFPDPPYGKEDYHISYTYDCKF